MAISSILKLLTYTAKCSKQPISVRLNGHQYDFKAREKFYIMPSFWEKDYCTCCGICCGNFDTVYSANEYKNITNTDFLNICKEHSVIINNKEHSYFSSDPMTSKDFNGIYSKLPNRRACRWSVVNESYFDTSNADIGNSITDISHTKRQLFCELHTYRPITCGFPHMEIYGSEKSTNGYLGHKQYGRNHQLGCPVNVHTGEFDKNTLVSNIYWLTRLKNVAEEYELDTFLPEILSYLSKVDSPSDKPVEFKTAHKVLF